MGDSIQRQQAREEAEEIYDSSDPASVNRARKKAAREKAERLRVCQALLTHPDTRKWVFDLLNACHIYSNPFVPGQADTTAFNLGEQNVGKRLLVDFTTADPALYNTMLKENQ